MEENVTIHDEHGDFVVPAQIWLNMLTCARRYGWNPAGTKPPSLGFLDPRIEARWVGWGRRYFPAEGQTITARDAKVIAAALTKALADPSQPRQPETSENGDQTLASDDLDLDDPRFEIGTENSRFKVSG